MTQVSQAAAEQRALRDWAWRPVAVIVGATVASLQLVAARDGCQRDELHLLEAPRQLALGLVDQPPLSILMAGLARVVFGDSLTRPLLSRRAIDAEGERR